MESALQQVLDRAFRYAYALTHDESVAADCVQDACLATLNAGGSWTVPYLFTAIRSRLYNRWRNEARLAQVRSLDALEEEPLPRSYVDSANEVAAQDWVENALAMLKPDERETLYLCVVEGWSTQEVAEFSARPRNTILGILHRAKKHLRERLDAPDASDASDAPEVSAQPTQTKSTDEA